MKSFLVKHENTTSGLQLFGYCYKTVSLRYSRESWLQFYIFKRHIQAMIIGAKQYVINDKVIKS